MRAALLLPDLHAQCGLQASSEASHGVVRAVRITTHSSLETTHMASTKDAVQFYWDPVCPWCWITSRWMEDVGRQKTIDVDWRFFSLRKINEGRDLPERFRVS